MLPVLTQSMNFGRVVVHAVGGAEALLRVEAHRAVGEREAARAALRQPLDHAAVEDEAVARLSGWGTLRNFQLHFTQRTGVAPHEWRVRQRS